VGELLRNSKVKKMPEISTREYAKAYSVATGAVLESSIDHSYPHLPQPERQALAIAILDAIAHRHGYRLAPLIPLEEHDGGE
jgi:hypothetical protein